MIREIFEFYYTTHTHPVRLKPLSRDELCRGMSPEAADQYITLVEELYKAFERDVNAKFVRLSDEVLNQKYIERETIYDALIKHLFKQDAISDEAYCELHKVMPVDFNFIERPDIPGKYVSDTLEDFRLAFERSIVDNDINVNLTHDYLIDRYGYNYCVRPEAEGKHFVSDSDLFLFRHEDAQQLPLPEISYWEARNLLRHIQYDRERNADEQKRLDADFCKPKLQYSYIATLQKTTYKAPKTIQEWYTIKRALEVESGYLWDLEHKIKWIFDAMKKPSDTVGSGASLYIYIQRENRLPSEKAPHCTSNSSAA